ncbi:MAG TPA: TRAP transporter TatT component family protein [Deltaproteobacteria bacterium]|nr:TRAP transporter TatT component family protein [Deltaproteobacteria bacterium]HOI05796.1 TRAP transporter TatT component family protein [Deltaproteobacteria bacterium]
MAKCSFRFARLFLILTVTVLLSGSLVFLSGCHHRKAHEEKPAGTYLEDIYAVSNPSTDLERFSSAMPSYLEYLDTLINPHTEDPVLFGRVSGAYYGDAYCNVEDKDPKEASRLYLKGRDLCLEELRRYRIFNQAYTYKKTAHDIRQSLPASFNKKNFPLIFWTAMNWAGWISVNLDKPEAREDIPKVIAMLEFASSFDDSYNSGIIHAMLGSLYAMQPRDEGGSPERSKEEFDKAFSCSFNSILTFHVMYARYYACQVQDRELFKRSLETVLNAPVDLYSDMNFVNEVAKKKARILMADMNRYFKEPEKQQEDSAKQEAESAAKEDAGQPQETEELQKNDQADSAGSETEKQ